MTELWPSGRYQRRKNARALGRSGGKDAQHTSARQAGSPASSRVGEPFLSDEIKQLIEFFDTPTRRGVGA
jgi:hypothetical protein